MSDGSPFRATLAAATLGVAAGVAMGWRWGAADASAAGDRRPDSDARGGGVSAAGDAVAPPSPTPSCAPAPSPRPPSSRGPRRRVDSLGPPIGRVHSCFSRRNGTPRQGGDLVPSARCVLTLAPGLPVDLLAGLDQYSHVWIIYVFHANTNMGGDTRNGGAVKAKVAVPRLDGAAVGALATRTPHRPLPLGLSLGRVVAVDPAAGTLTLGGADLVDGTPVLDVKPYVPFCDRVERAVAPAWVGREAADRDEPLAVTRVESAEGAEDAVATAYEASVKERRRIRLQREHASEEKGGAGTRTGRARHKGKRNGGGGGPRAEPRGGERAEGGERAGVGDPSLAVGDVSSCVSNPEAAKRAKREAKARRQAGLEPPDALYPSGSAFVAFAREVLALDMRAVRERRAAPERRKFATYRVTLCDVEVEYAVGEDRVVTMLGGRAVAPLEEPGVTSKPEKEKTRAE